MLQLAVAQISEQVVAESCAGCCCRALQVPLHAVGGVSELQRRQTFQEALDSITPALVALQHCHDKGRQPDVKDTSVPT